MHLKLTEMFAGTAARNRIPFHYFTTILQFHPFHSHFTHYRYSHDFLEERYISTQNFCHFVDLTPMEKNVKMKKKVYIIWFY